MVCYGIRDFDIHRDVLSELDWSQDVHSTEVGVQVANGIVILLGSVRSPLKRVAAVDAAHRVEGVRAVVDSMTVHLAAFDGHDDAAIAHSAANALDGLIRDHVDHISITVEDGRITLGGQVRTVAERMEAENFLSGLKGVSHVVNWIRVTGATPDPGAIHSSIEQSFQTLAEQAARRVSIEIDGTGVILRGTVDTWGERDEAERAAVMAGATEVDNQIQVYPHVQVRAEEVCYIAG